MIKIFKSGQEVIEKMIQVSQKLTTVGDDILNGIYYCGTERSCQQTTNEVVKDLSGEFQELIEAITAIKNAVDNGLITSTEKYEEI